MMEAMLLLAHDFRRRVPFEQQVCRESYGLFIIKLPSGSNSVVECDLAKVEVAGSNPVSRSKV